MLTRSINGKPAAIISEDRMEWEEETMIDMVDGKRRGRPRLDGWME